MGNSDMADGQMIGASLCACCICTGVIIGCAFPFMVWSSVSLGGDTIDMGAGLWGFWYGTNANGGSSKYYAYDSCDNPSISINGMSFGLGSGDDLCVMQGLYVFSLLLTFIAFIATCVGACGNKMALAAAAALHFLAGFFMMVTAAYITNQFEGAPENANFTYAAPWLYWILSWVVAGLCGMAWKSHDQKSEAGGAATSSV